MERTKVKGQPQPGEDFVDFSVSDTALSDFRRQGMAAGWPERLGYRRTSAGSRLAARELSDDKFLKHILRGGGLYLQSPKDQRVSVLEQEIQALHVELAQLKNRLPGQQQGPAFGGVVEEEPLSA